MWKSAGAGLSRQAGAVNSGLPDILLIHGAGGTALTMQRLLHKLAPYANGLALNLPGRDNGGPALDHIEKLAAYVAGFIDGAQTRPWILGHSLGAAIALETARMWPDMAAGLILVNASTSLPLSEPFMERLVKDIPMAMGGFLQKAAGPGAGPAIADTALATINSLPPQTVINDFKACRTYNALPYLKDITLPVLVVYGEDDVITRPAEAREIASKLANATMAGIEHMGHMGILEAPDKIAGQIGRFLQEGGG